MRKTGVLIDCDTGIDDIMALTHLLRADNIDILGVTTVAGNQTLDLTTYNTLNALAFMGRADIPLAQGAAEPLERELHSAGYIHGESGLGTFSFPEPTAKCPEKLDAPAFIAELVKRSACPLTILALGPLTNIALFYQRYPELLAKVEKVIFMGGALATGNPTPVATFNVLCDPEAARIVINGEVPFYMVPLDTTVQAYITDSEIEQLKALGNPVSAMCAELCDFYNATVNNSNNARERFAGLCIHDLVTGVYLTNPEFFTIKRYWCDVECRGELTTGFTMIDNENIKMLTTGSKNIYYVDSVDRAALLKLWFKSLSAY